MSDDRYENSLQHLLAALHRLDLLIELRLLKFRRQHKLTEPREFRGLYISDEEIAVALQSSTASSAAQRMSKEEEQKEQVLRDRLAETNQQIHQKTAAASMKE
jgi:winged helix domain-containing protein